MARSAASKVTASDWSKGKEEMRSILIDLARKGQTISYGDLCRLIESVHLFPRAPMLIRLLTEICHEEEALGRGNLCALVVRKATGIPGGGYFGGLASPDRDASDLEALWRADRDEVFDYWSKHS